MIFVLVLGPAVGALAIIGISEAVRRVRRHLNRHKVLPYGHEWAGYFEGDESAQDN